jgi:hypothetical protein
MSTKSNHNITTIHSSRTCKVHSTKEDSLISLKVHDPYYRGKPLYICIAKEWFDKVNGNSYWSARVEDIENDITYVFPWQYGYGDSSLHEVMRALNLSHFPCLSAFPFKSFRF